MSLRGFTRETIISQTRVDKIYCSEDLQVDVLNSAITDLYTVEAKLDEKKRNRVKMQEYYRNWAVLENILKKLLFKPSHNLQCFQENRCLLTATQYLRNFYKLSLMK